MFYFQKRYEKFQSVGNNSDFESVYDLYKNMRIFWNNHHRYKHRQPLTLYIFKNFIFYFETIHVTEWHYDEKIKNIPERSLFEVNISVPEPM